MKGSDPIPIDTPNFAYLSKTIYQLGWYHCTVLNAMEYCKTPLLSLSYVTVLWILLTDWSVSGMVEAW